MVLQTRYQRVNFWLPIVPVFRTIAVFLVKKLPLMGDFLRFSRDLMMKVVLLIKDLLTDENVWIFAEFFVVAK